MQYELTIKVCIIIVLLYLLNVLLTMCMVTLLSLSTMYADHHYQL